MRIPAWIRSISPSHRRWTRLLTSLTIEPDGLGRPLDEPGPRDFIICGLPRSGTSLLCAALYQPPTCITVMEPWDGMRLPPAELFASLRSEARSGTMRRGRLDVPRLISSGEVHWGRNGEHPHQVRVEGDFSLGVKWPAYWRYLDLLPNTRFLVCVRDPVEVLSSWERTGGRLADGLDYDIAFHREMNAWLRAATDDIELRRALLLEQIASGIARHVEDENVLLVRYERWVTDRAGLTQEIGRFLDVELGSGYPEIRPPQQPASPRRIEDVVARHCPSVAALGYDMKTSATDRGDST